MTVLIKCIIILGLSIVMLPLIGVARKMQLSWLSIPLMVAYAMGVVAAWNYGKKKAEKDMFEIDKKTDN